jgi:hypothetical protein
MNTHEDRFEDRLLLALRSVVDANPAPVHSLAPAPRSLRRPVLAGGAVAAAAVTATSLLVAGGSSAAYAVDAHSDGSVTVTINSFKDAAGLQSKLEAAGIKADVTYLPAGKSCKQPRFEPSTGAVQGRVSGSATKDGPATFTIGKGEVPAGDTLVIENSGGDRSASVGVSVAAGAVAPCEVVDAPLTGPPGSNGSGPGPVPGLHAGTGSGQGRSSQQG